MENRPEQPKPMKARDVLTVHPEQILTDEDMRRQLRFSGRYWGLFRVRAGRVVGGEVGAFINPDTLERDQQTRISITGCNKRLL